MQNLQCAISNICTSQTDVSPAANLVLAQKDPQTEAPILTITQQEFSWLPQDALRGLKRWSKYSITVKQMFRA